MAENKTIEDKARDELTSSHAHQLTEVRARAAGLEGDLAKEQLRSAELEEKVAKLEAELVQVKQVKEEWKKGKHMLPGNAAEIAEPVTTADVNGVRITPTIHDVVLLASGDAAKDTAEREALQRKLGSICRVYTVTAETLDELRLMNAVAGS